MNVFGCITEKNGRLFCCIATYFGGCNGICDLLTRQARNFIYSGFQKKKNHIKLDVKIALLSYLIILLFIFIFFSILFKH